MEKVILHATTLIHIYVTEHKLVAISTAGVLLALRTARAH